jgi:hypothetical protein
MWTEYNFSLPTLIYSHTHHVPTTYVLTDAFVIVYIYMCVSVYVYVCVCVWESM